MDKIRNQAGQAMTEYILLLSILVALFSLLVRLLGETRIVDRLKNRLEKDYKYTYRYGHPKARGPDDDGGVKYIPQYIDPNGVPKDFRIFINPPIK